MDSAKLSPIKLSQKVKVKQYRNSLSFLKVFRDLVLILAVICSFLSSVPSYGEALHLELAPDHKEVLYLSEEEIESLVLDDSLKVVVLGEADSEAVLASGGLAVMVGTAVLPRASGKVLAGVRSLSGSGGKKVLVLGVVSAALARSFFKMQGEEDFVKQREDKSLFSAEGEGWESEPSPKKLVPPLFGENDEESLAHWAQATEDQLRRVEEEREMISKVYGLRLKTYAYEQGIQEQEISKEERLRLMQEIVLNHIDELSLLSQSRFSKILSDGAKDDFSKQEAFVLNGSLAGSDWENLKPEDQVETIILLGSAVVGGGVVLGLGFGVVSAGALLSAVASLAIFVAASSKDIADELRKLSSKEK